MVGAAYDSSIFWVPTMNRVEYYHPDWLELLKKIIVVLNIVMILRHANILQGIYNISKEIESVKPTITEGRTLPRVVYDKIMD
jgi:hypothetical protein